jgi:hypothetical protein
MNEPNPLGALLTSLSADLLSERRYEAFCHRLFAVPSGTWQRVADLCAELTDLPAETLDVLATHADNLFVTHLPWPGPTLGEPEDSYALVLFVHAGELWSTIVAYNREMLRRGGQSREAE